MDVVSEKPTRNSGSSLQPEFPGSMNLAYTLLVTVGIASIIGAVLKQSDTYQNFSFKRLVSDLDNRLRSLPCKA